MSALTVGLCQFRPTKGVPAANLDRIEQIFRTAAAAPSPPDVLVFPEGILSGYFLEGGVREHAWNADALFAELATRHARAGGPPVEIALGFYEQTGDRLHNSAMWAALGGSDAGVRHIHRKIFLPTYGVFDEERFVEAGTEVHAFPTRFGRAALLVCEDAWHSITSTIAAVDGAQLIAVVAASPARGLAPDAAHPGLPNSLVRWERLACDIAGEHGVFVALSQLVGFEGGKGFPGGSLLAGPAGDVLARAPVFEDSFTAHAVDLDDIARVRAESPLLADLEMRLPHLLDTLRTRRAQPADAPAVAPAAPRRALPAPRPDLSIDPLLTRRWLVEFLRDEVSRRRGFARAVIGLSGGLDSAVVAWLAAEALGAENVIGVRMPYRASSADSLEHAHVVTTALGIEERTIDISAAVDGVAAQAMGELTPHRLGNIMARVRMLTLFDCSAARNALPIGTGNKSERLLGYFTWHGDDAPPVNPVGDLFKTQMRALAEHLGLPREIIDKEPSADLAPGQTDEGDFGVTYAIADGILDLLIRSYDDAAITAAGFDAKDVALVRKRLDATHWKRRLPSVAMVSQTAIGEYYLRPVDY